MTDTKKIANMASKKEVAAFDLPCVRQLRKPLNTLTNQ